MSVFVVLTSKLSWHLVQYLKKSAANTDFFFLLFSSADIIALSIFFFPSVGVCKMYEEHLKRMNPNSPSITYDISQLFDFIDDLADLSCLV